MASFSFAQVIQHSPVIGDEVKSILLAEEPTIAEEAKRAIVASLLGYEEEIYKAAREYIWTHPKTAS